MWRLALSLTGKIGIHNIQLDTTLDFNYLGYNKVIPIISSLLIAKQNNKFGPT